MASLSAHDKKILWIASLGGVLEYYDFIVYALLAGYLSQSFFPTGNPLTSLLSAFAVYAVGYMVRPLSGLIFGHYGDQYSRSKPFTLSILLMAVSTFGIGFLPTYDQVGLLAPVLLILLRIVQGFSVGGEVPGALTYVSEKINQRKGLVCGCIFAGLALGASMGSLVVAILKSFWPEELMSQWGWRIPFVLGGLVGFMSYYQRKLLAEPELFVKNKKKDQGLPIKILFSSYKRHVIFGLAIASMAGATASLLSIFLPAYISSIIHYHMPNFMWFYSVILTISATMNIVVGKLSDKIDRQKMLWWLLWTTFIVAYPVYKIFSNYQFLMLLGLFLASVPNMLAFGLIPGLLTELFPQRVRYTGVAFCYGLGVAVFCGLTPLMATSLIFHLDSNMAPAWLLMWISVVTMVIVWWYQYKNPKCHKGIVP